MPVAISYKETARAQFRGLERARQRAIVGALAQIVRNPLHPPYWLDVEPISGMIRGWRLSIDGFRVTYRLEPAKLVVLDVDVGHEVYRKWGTPDL